MNRKGILLGALSVFIFIILLSIFNSKPTRVQAIPENGDSQAIMHMLARISTKVDNVDKRLYEQENFIINSLSKIDKKHAYISFENIDNDLNLHFKLLVLISSDVRHTERRNNIRKWWGNKTNWMTDYEWKVIFLLADQLKKH